jgi:hypothetical protein
LLLRPDDPHTIRARIRRYERALREEQARFGCIRDGAGTRYVLGPLYLLLGDTAGALQSFIWFAETFPDDSGDPVHFLCWTLALYRTGEKRRAAGKLRQTILSNLYLLPRLLGREQDVIDMWHPSNLTEKSYSDAVPDAWLALWDPPALHWPHGLSAREYAACAAPLHRDLPPTADGAHRTHTKPPGR